MKKFRKITTLILISLFLTNCGKEKLQLNELITLSGTVTIKEVVTGDTTTKVTILNLDEPVIINGETVHKIELDYDKGLKNNSELTITGTLQSNPDSPIDLNFSFAVNDIDDILSYVNTFSNKEFSMTIPVDLMKITTIKEIENGFIIYSTANMSTGGEVFRIISITNEEFKTLNRNETKYIEKITSTKENTVIVQYPTTQEYSDKNFKDYETITSKVNIIKDSVRLK